MLRNIWGVVPYLGQRVLKAVHLHAPSVCVGLTACTLNLDVLVVASHFTNSALGRMTCSCTLHGFGSSTQLTARDRLTIRA